MTVNHPSEVTSVTEAFSAQNTGAMAERLLRGIGRAASPEAVFGTPVTAHGRTIIPVARVYFALGGGGGQGQGEGKAGAHDPSVLSTGSGGGGGSGGLGVTVASGYIEISAEGSRYVAVGSNRDRLIGIAVGLLAGMLLARLLRR